ncbi:hypothetical protein C0992_004676 [Termitomyces sp. T32_za158]|nr:hypothetical protein C0992_004676 [Termitomyces sp. T32_za158]
MDVDEEGRYERREEEIAYHLGPSRPQGGSQSYARAVAQPLFEEYAPQAQRMEAAWAVAPVAARPGPAVVLTTSTLPARPPAAPTVSWAPEVPLAELSLEQRDEEMINAPVDRDEMALMDAIEAGARTRVTISQAAGPSTQRLTMSFHAPAMQGLSRLPRGRKPPLKIADMELVDFPAGVPA